MRSVSSTLVSGWCASCRRVGASALRVFLLCHWCFFSPRQRLVVLKPRRSLHSLAPAARSPSLRSSYLLPPTTVRGSRLAARFVRWTRFSSSDVAPQRPADGVPPRGFRAPGAGRGPCPPPVGLCLAGLRCATPTQPQPRAAAHFCIFSRFGQAC